MEVYRRKLNNASSPLEDFAHKENYSALSKNANFPPNNIRRQDSTTSSWSAGTSMSDDEGEEKNPDGSIKLHTCDKCGKTYKQRNSLHKHIWEHSPYWELSRRFNMSKHQQVQAMQAAMQLLNLKGKCNWMEDLPEVRFLDMK